MQKGYQTLNLNKSQYNLKEVILNIITDYKSQIKSEGKDNKVKLMFASKENDDDNIFVYGDAERMTQVISNLLSNAIKFTEEGLVVVKIERKKDSDKKNQEVVLVSVRDTGKGVEPTIEDKLFEKFATKSEKGIGLGLYLSRKIIEAHYGGMIWAENNNAKDGKGATFYFCLPLSR